MNDHGRLIEGNFKSFRQSFERRLQPQRPSFTPHFIDTTQQPVDDDQGYLKDLGIQVMPWGLAILAIIFAGLHFTIGFPF